MCIRDRLTGDPAIIGVACSIVSDITHGKFNLLKWDKQERKYYPIEINFEADQQDAMKKTGNIQSLADQVERLEAMQQQLEIQEEAIKEKKKQIQHISGEVIPTMMSEMGLAELKLQDGSHLKVSTSYRATITLSLIHI